RSHGLRADEDHRDRLAPRAPPPRSGSGRRDGRARRSATCARSTRSARRCDPTLRARSIRYAATRARSRDAAPTRRATVARSRSRRVGPPAEKPGGDAPVRIDAPIAEEGPVAARALDEGEVAFGDEDLALARRSAREHASEGIADEGIAPELDRALGADAVRGDDEDAVRDRVRPVHDLPRLALRFAELILLVREPADRRRIAEDLGAEEADDARGLGIPLVPAD